MSKILDSDNIEFGSWRYAAFEMEACLKEMIETKSTKKNKIPMGIYKDLLEFFDLILGAIEKTQKNNPLIQIENYRIAANAIRKCKPSANRIELNKDLTEYAKLFKILDQDRKLSEDDLEKLKELQHFFNKIFKFSDTKVYESVVASNGGNF